MLSQVLGFSIITPALYEKLIKTSQKLSNFSISYFISENARSYVVDIKLNRHYVFIRRVTN